MTLGCTLKSGEKKEVRIALNPPLSGYDDVKPRLLEMKAISQENLGMVRYKCHFVCVTEIYDIVDQNPENLVLQLAPRSLG